jgi:hypothetical protein
MSKLHELLAVDTQVKGQAEVCRKDLINTFEKKRHSHFTRKTTTFVPNAEGRSPVVESHQDLQSTVSKELQWIGDKLAKAIDIGHQVDMANTVARADVILDDGSVLLSQVPATSLLQIAHRVKEIQELVNAIPTLDPAQGFSKDDSMSTASGTVYKALDVIKPRTEKSFDFVVMVAPTEKFPAQVKELTVDKKIGETLTQEWSGLITVSEKAEMLDRVEQVAKAVKTARARANELEMPPVKKIGDTVLNYIFNAKKA